MINDTKTKLSLSTEEVKKVVSSFENNQTKKRILTILRKDPYTTLVCEKIQSREDYESCFGIWGYFENNKEMESNIKKYLMEHPQQLYDTIEKMSSDKDVWYDTVDIAEMPTGIDRRDNYYNMIGKNALQRFSFVENTVKWGESLAKYFKRYEKEIWKTIDLKDIKIVEDTVNKLLEPMKGHMSIRMRDKGMKKKNGAFDTFQIKDNRFKVGLN